MSAYADHAFDWLNAGWGPLPLPAGQKFPPPKHWTGYGAAYPSGADVQAWIEEPEYADANLALRFPANVIGIDVDEYGDKHGRATLIEHTRKWGQLPATARITSRPDTISGIYLYRLPAVASSGDFIGELPGGNVEILRKEHRYAVAPGSLHPEGRTYVLVESDGCFAEDDEVISPDDLPELPAAWVDGLTVHRIEKVKTPDVELAEGRGNRYVESALGYVIAELHEIATWPIGKTDDRGRGWEKIQADAAFRLASLALADWNDLTIEQAGRAFGEAAPRGGNWTDYDVATKWRSQLNRAEPADPPATSDDPLDPGYIGPESPAPKMDAFEEAAGDGDRGVPLAPAGDLGPALADPVESAPPPVAPRVSDEWTKHSWDDIGNGERLIEMHGGTLRFIPEVKTWFRYDEESGTWEDHAEGGELAARELMKALPMLEAHLYSSAEYKKGDKTTSERKEFLKWATEQRFMSKLSSAARVARLDGSLRETLRAFDNEPMMLNVRNGVIDLHTGELRRHEAHLKLRRQVPVEYDPHAKAPRWEAWLEQMMPDTQMRAYLKRMFGYSLTGDTGEQVMFLHHGPPATGKSVFLQILGALLGEFARTVPPTTLLTKRQEQHPTDIMSLDGRRVLQLDEIPEGSRLDEALVKRLTGESTITARGIAENWREFRIIGKVHLVTNHLPHISDDPATHRRIHMVRWDVEIPVEDRIQGLAQQFIREELPGILAWAVEGCLEWQSELLSRPAEAELAALDYFQEEDEFGDFLAEKIVSSDIIQTTTSSLYRYYSSWCSASNVKPMSKVAFGRKLAKRGFKPWRTKKDRGFYCALATDPILTGVPVDPLDP